MARKVKVKADSEDCPLCECYMEVVVSAYAQQPFIDGRCYEQICFCCNNVPKTWHYDEKTNEVVVYPWHPDQLCDLDDFKVDGFNVKDPEDKKRVQTSIKAVKNSIRDHLDKDLRKKWVERHNAKITRNPVKDYTEYTTVAPVAPVAKASQPQPSKPPKAPKLKKQPRVVADDDDVLPEPKHKLKKFKVIHRSELQT